jgi:hypothetical protein
MHILFVDYFKALDRVLHRKLWDIMTNKSWPDHDSDNKKYF